MLRLPNAAIKHLGASRLEAQIFVGHRPRQDKDVLLAGSGFRSVVNTMSSDYLGPRECIKMNLYYPSALNLAYCHIPVDSLCPDGSVVDAFAGALNALPLPLFVLSSDVRCSVNLWALARSNDWGAHEICRRCTEFDLKTDELMRRIEARRAFASFVPGGAVH